MSVVPCALGTEMDHADQSTMIGSSADAESNLAAFPLTTASSSRPLELINATNVSGEEWPYEVTSPEIATDLKVTRTDFIFSLLAGRSSRVMFVIKFPNESMDSTCPVIRWSPMIAFGNGRDTKESSGMPSR